MIIEGNIESGDVWYGCDPTPWKLNLEMSLAVINHSPSGFSWGYNGSGPAQLALALLLLTTDKDTAIFYHQKFKDEVIAVLPQKDFQIEFDLGIWIKNAIQMTKLYCEIYK